MPKRSFFFDQVCTRSEVFTERDPMYERQAVYGSGTRRTGIAGRRTGGQGAAARSVRTEIPRSRYYG